MEMKSRHERDLVELESRVRGEERNKHRRLLEKGETKIEQLKEVIRD